MIDDVTYRVTINKDRSATVQWFGAGGDIDSALKDYYPSVDDLPNWVQERLAVLMMIPTAKPIPEIPGVGRRITTHIFWVYAPE